MAIYVCKISDGLLVSTCPNDADPIASAEDLAANGLEAHVGLPSLDDTHEWDAATRTVVTVTPAPSPRWLPSYDFALAFTAQEYAAIKASSDANVQHLMFALGLAQQVDMNSQTIQQGVAYLAGIGLITSDRAAIILATQAA